MSDVLVLRLPLPHASLSPNARVYWTESAKEKARAKEQAKTAMIGAKHQFSQESKLRLTLIVFWKDRRKRDLDNLQASCKAMIDGIFTVLQLNDEQINEITTIRGPLNKNDPHIKCYIQEITDEVHCHK